MPHQRPINAPPTPIHNSQEKDPRSPNTIATRKPDGKTTQIEEALASRAEEDASTIKLLLLGPGESGKSTLFKQIQTIYGQGFTQEMLKAALPQVHNNTMLCLKALADNYAVWGDVSEENEDIVEYLQGLSTADIESASLEEKYISQYKSLWADPVIKTAWKHRSEFQIYGCAEYLLERISAFVEPGYIPSLLDLLQIRVRTTGIVESVFSVESVKMKLVDVGGQRNERRKWVHCFAGVTAVIFVAAISEYDQKLFEDADVNRLEEALVLFDEVCNSTYFSNTPILLFLNKKDLFEEKISRVPLSQFLPGFPGPDYDTIAASDWIAEQFRTRNTSNRNKIVYCIVTTAVERNVVRDLFVTVKDIIVREALQGTALQ
jgi:GTPase SAR1 family protein